MATAVAQIAAVPLDMLLRTWPLVQAWIGEALMHSARHELRPSDILMRLAQSRYVLLVAERAGELVGCVVIGRDTRPDGKPYVGVMCCGGEGVDTWLDEMVEAVKTVARGTGAAQILVHGRVGWSRLLARHGARVRAQTLVCELEQ